jgi:hypothetical protein
MTADRFRKDKFLRATGYNFYVWGAVNILVVLPVWCATMGHPWRAWVALVHPIALIVLGAFASGLNDNRVEKMWGPASAEPVVDAAAFWAPTFLIGLVLTVVLAVRGPAAYIQPLWLLLIGAAYLTWGNFGVPEFRWLGWTLVGAGTVAGLAIDPSSIDRHLGSPFALAVWVVFMGILWFPFGTYINRRYVWAVAERQDAGVVGGVGEADEAE